MRPGDMLESRSVHFLPPWRKWRAGPEHLLALRICLSASSHHPALQFRPSWPRKTLTQRNCYQKFADKCRDAEPLAAGDSGLRPAVIPEPAARSARARSFDPITKSGDAQMNPGTPKGDELCKQCGHAWNDHKLLGYGSRPTEGWMECPVPGCQCRISWSLELDVAAQNKARGMKE
jgi:hypothetical protein